MTPTSADVNQLKASVEAVLVGTTKIAAQANLVADTMAIMASLDPVMGGVDK